MLVCIHLYPPPSICCVWLIIKSLPKLAIKLEELLRVKNYLTAEVLVVQDVLAKVHNIATLKLMFHYGTLVWNRDGVLLKLIHILKCEQY